MQHGPRQCQTLLLPAGEVPRVFQKHGVKALLAFQEIRKRAVIQGLPQRRVIGVGRRQKKVIPHAALEEHGARTHVGNGFHEAVFRQGADLFSADGQRPAADGIPVHDQRSDGGFAAAAFAHDADKALFRDGEIHAVQDLPLLFIGKMHVFQLDADAPDALRFLVRFRLAQEFEDLIAGRHAVHGHMEIASQPPHGQEEIRREQDHEHHIGKADAAADKGLRRKQNPQRRAAVGHKVHDGDGIELHGEHRHGHLAEVLGFPVHLQVLVRVRLIGFQRGHALQVFQEGAAQLRILSPVFSQDLLRDLLHHHDGPRDQGHTNQQHRRYLPAAAEAKQEKEGDGRHEGIEKLRHILAEIAFQLVHALHGLLHQLRRGHVLPVGGAQTQQLSVNLFPHHPLHRAGGQIAHTHSPARGEEAKEHGAKNDQHGKAQVSQAPGAIIELLHSNGDGHDHRRVQAQLQKLQQNIAQNVLFALRTQEHQALVKHVSSLFSRLSPSFLWKSVEIVSQLLQHLNLFAEIPPALFEHRCGRIAVHHARLNVQMQPLPDAVPRIAVL